MTDNLSKDVRRRNMQAIRSTGTKLEEKISKELWKHGIRYRRNVKDLLGKPDLAIKKYKVVVFIDSCFWHGCPLHCRIPDQNRPYWEQKISRNKQRDTLVTEHYVGRGWHILRVWEHEIKSNFAGAIEQILEFINNAKGIASRTRIHK